MLGVVGVKGIGRLIVGIGEDEVEGGVMGGGVMTGEGDGAVLTSV